MKNIYEKAYARGQKRAKTDCSGFSEPAERLVAGKDGPEEFVQGYNDGYDDYVCSVDFSAAN